MKAMKFGAVALAVGISFGTAHAADQMIDLSSGQASFVSTGAVLDGGDDVLTFFGLAPGVYNYVFSVSSQFVTGFGGTVNGTLFGIASLGPITAGASFGVSSAPFTIVLTGSAAKNSVYSGELTVTAIPEPSTYALMVAGLAAVGFVARRRKA
jgi:hypothetical protein